MLQSIFCVKLFVFSYCFTSFILGVIFYSNNVIGVFIAKILLPNASLFDLFLLFYLSLLLLSVLEIIGILSLLVFDILRFIKILINK